jgi:predicted Holliday junction resolvase-like endonuclease
LGVEISFFRPHSPKVLAFSLINHYLQKNQRKEEKKKRLSETENGKCEELKKKSEKERREPYQNAVKSAGSVFCVFLVEIW